MTWWASKMARNTFSAKGGNASAPSDIRYATLAKGGKKICRSYGQGGCGRMCPYSGERVLHHRAARTKHRFSR